MLEIFRGCTRGCRFCQAGMIYRPVRERSMERLMEMAEKLVSATGYDEISLMSLSSGDYSCLPELAHKMVETLRTEARAHFAAVAANRQCADGHAEGNPEGQKDRHLHLRRRQVRSVCAT